MAGEKIGDLMRMYHVALTNLEMFGPKGEFTKDEFVSRFNGIRDAVVEHFGLKEEREFWALPENSRLGAKAEKLMSELIFWMAKIRGL